MKKEVEAILFSSSEPVSVIEIARTLKAKVEDVEKAIDEIVKDYESRDSAIEVLRLGDKVLMRVKPKYQHLVSGKRDLDRSILRTLGTIAVNQPIELSKLAKIRGNRCYGHVKRLEELGLVRSEKKGRTKVLTVTDAFIRYFGLDVKSVEEVREFLKSKIKDL